MYQNNGVLSSKKWSRLEIFIPAAPDSLSFPNWQNCRLNSLAEGYLAKTSICLTQ